jgi:hypothetical protein
MDFEPSARPPAGAPGPSGPEACGGQGEAAGGGGSGGEADTDLEWQSLLDTLDESGSGAAGASSELGCDTGVYDSPWDAPASPPCELILLAPFAAREAAGRLAAPPPPVPAPLPAAEEEQQAPVAAVPLPTGASAGAAACGALGAQHFCGPDGALAELRPIQVRARAHACVMPLRTSLQGDGPFPRGIAPLHAAGAALTLAALHVIRPLHPPLAPPPSLALHPHCPAQLALPFGGGMALALAQTPAMGCGQQAGALALQLLPGAVWPALGFPMNLSALPLPVPSPGAMMFGGSPAASSEVRRAPGGSSACSGGVQALPACVLATGVIGCVREREDTAWEGVCPAGAVLPG